MKVFWERYPKENRKNVLFHGTYVLVVTMLIAFIVISRLDISQSNPFVRLGVNKEIFTYLKNVQEIEENFYKILQEDTKLLQTGKLQEEIDLQILAQHIKVMEDIVLKLSGVDTNPYIIENHHLLLEEVINLRDTLVEQKIAIENPELQSDKRIRTYFERYKLVAQARRIVLKKIFDQQGIAYIDLGDRIKYKVK